MRCALLFSMMVMVVDDLVGNRSWCNLNAMLHISYTMFWCMYMLILCVFYIYKCIYWEMYNNNDKAIPRTLWIWTTSKIFGMYILIYDGCRVLACKHSSAHWTNTNLSFHLQHFYIFCIYVILTQFTDDDCKRYRKSNINEKAAIYVLCGS